MKYIAALVTVEVDKTRAISLFVTQASGNHCIKITIFSYGFVPYTFSFDMVSSVLPIW